VSESLSLDKTAGPVARLVTYGVVGVIVLAGVTGHEYWPLSGFRLFSEVRSSQQTTYSVVVVNEQGQSSVLDLGALPDNYSGHVQMLPAMVTKSADEQAAIVQAWLVGLGLTPGEYTSAEIYRSASEVPADSAEPAVVTDRELVLTVPLS
jgi:hypothetical protein